MIARSIMNMDTVWPEIDALDNQIKSEDQIKIMMVYVRLLRRITRWFLKRKHKHIDIEQATLEYKPYICDLKKAIPDCFGPSLKEHFDKSYEEYLALNISQSMALSLARTRGLFVSMEILDITHRVGISIAETATAYFGLGEFLDVGWLREQVIIHPTDNHWEALSREALRDDFDGQQRKVTLSIFKSKPKEVGFQEYLQVWAARNATKLKRWHEMMLVLKATEKLTFTMFFVAVREFMGFNLGVSKKS